MKKNMLFKTNTAICIVIMVGFIITSVISYFSNRQTFEKDIKAVSALTSESIYHEIDGIFNKPIHISETMANDTLLQSYLEKELDHLEDVDFTKGLQQYLVSYRDKYQYDSVFLVSTATNRYYHFNGIDRVLNKENQENVWYYSFLKSKQDYALNIDNDEAANNEITVFINCKIYNGNDVAGVVGVGFRIDSLQVLLKHYEETSAIKAFLIDPSGTIEVSTNQSGYQKENFFEQSRYLDLHPDKLMSSEGADFWYNSSGKNGYMVSRYIDNLGWYLVIDHDMSNLKENLSRQFLSGIIVIAAVIIAVLVIITYIIRKYNHQIIDLTIENEKEHRTIFQEVTEHMYENIYEFDITHNCAASEATQAYLETLGVPKNTPYDAFLNIVANRQIKEEFREGYLQMFQREHVLEMFEKGEDTLVYDFMISRDASRYDWERITARLFTWKEDASIRMFTYHQNIDAQKLQERKLMESMEMDSLSLLYNKAATQDKISKILQEKPGLMYAFFILDMDDFKKVNDTFGHAAGDKVIADFAHRLKQNFRQDDIVGRIGGDEFVAFIAVGSSELVNRKAEELIKTLHYEFQDGHIHCLISSSIGISFAPEAGKDFDSLYKKADIALYQAKAEGKGKYVIYHE